MMATIQGTAYCGGRGVASVAGRPHDGEGRGRLLLSTAVHRLVAQNRDPLTDSSATAGKGR
jgi:hypothetical protein